DFNAGDLGLQRNFYNPEFDAKLTDYLAWTRDAPGLSLFTPDEFKFRFAWWGFYDGVFDYSDPEWKRALRGELKGADLAAYRKICATAGCDPRQGPKARLASSDDV